MGRATRDGLGGGSEPCQEGAALGRKQQPRRRRSRRAQFDDASSSLRFLGVGRATRRTAPRAGPYQNGPNTVNSCLPVFQTTRRSNVPKRWCHRTLKCALRNGLIGSLLFFASPARHNIAPALISVGRPRAAWVPSNDDSKAMGTIRPPPVVCGRCLCQKGLPEYFRALTG